VTTAADLIEETRLHLTSGRNEQINELSADYTAGSRSMTFKDDLRGITAGHTISVGLNTLYVVSVSESSKSAVVVGGRQGSSDVNADAGQLVRVQPAWTDHRIFKELNNDLRSLSSPSLGLYQQKAKVITFVALTHGYDLAADVISVDEVRVDVPGAERSQPPIRSFEVIRQADTALFPSGVALRINEPGVPGRALRVKYRAPFLPLAGLTADVAATGLPDTAYDLPPMGAALRLIAVKEIDRNQTGAQPDPRRANEVPPGAMLGSYRGLAGMRAQRIEEERSRLRAQNPIRVQQ
jgi:hypothetical protein